jgi:hypothetical protein
VRQYSPSVVLPGRRLFPRSAQTGDYGMQAFLDANRDRSPIYFCDVVLWDDARAGYALWPTGLVDRVMARGAEPEAASWLESSRASLSRIDPAILATHPVDSWEHAVLVYYWKQAGKNALALARSAQLHNGDRQALEWSAQLLERLIAAGADAPPGVHRDLAAVYQQLSAYDPVFDAKMRQEFAAYLNVAPPNDPELPRIRELLGR